MGLLRLHWDSEQTGHACVTLIEGDPPVLGLAEWQHARALGVVRVPETDPSSVVVQLPANWSPSEIRDRFSGHRISVDRSPIGPLAPQEPVVLERDGDCQDGSAGP